MKSFLTGIFVALVLVQTRAVDLLSKPPAVVNPSPEVKLTYERGSASAPFQLQWILTDLSSTYWSDTNYVGIGFQNGLAADTDSGSLNMYGPEGTDFFILRGPRATPTVEFRTLGKQTTTMKSKGSPPAPQESFQITSTTPSGSRIMAFSMASAPGNYTTYTVKIACSKGSKGMTDFTRPTAVLFAFSQLDEKGQVKYHGPTGEDRSWKRTDFSSNSPLALQTICSGGNSGNSGNVLSFGIDILLIAALIALCMI